MVAMGRCPACQWGEHENHVASYAPAPPGVMGGQMCPCTGDCELTEENRRAIARWT